jgi:Tfp pilus assembly protein PilV
MSPQRPYRPPVLGRPSPAAGPALPATRYPLPATSSGFTIVEVMMASVILVVGLMGMIQGVTIGSEMMATARRQTIAAQILEHEISKLRLADWATVSALTNSSAATYDSDQASIDTAIAASGVSFNLARTVTLITTDLYEVAFTVTWTKSGTTTAATTATGSWLNKLSFAGSAPIARTYTRKSTAYFGKYGLNLKL